LQGRVTIPSDPHYAARKQLEFDRVNGGRSVHAHINLRQVNPITVRPEGWACVPALLGLLV